MEELENYSEEFKKRLDEVGELGKVPTNLALEVSNGKLSSLKKASNIIYFEVFT